MKVVRLGTCHFFVLWSSYWAEAGRDHEKLIILARPYTPYVEPDVLVVAVGAGIQVTITVVQVVRTVAIARSRGPPVAVASIVERAIVVASASNRRKSGAVASNIAKFI